MFYQHSFFGMLYLACFVSLRLHLLISYPKSSIINSLCCFLEKRLSTLKEISLCRVQFPIVSDSFTSDYGPREKQHESIIVKQYSSCEIPKCCLKRDGIRQVILPKTTWCPNGNRDLTRRYSNFAFPPLANPSRTLQRKKTKYQSCLVFNEKKEAYIIIISTKEGRRNVTTNHYKKY